MRAGLMRPVRRRLGARRVVALFVALFMALLVVLLMALFVVLRQRDRYGDE
jgi:type II secretory pathway component PulL